jgi:hypothetical protein
MILPWPKGSTIRRFRHGLLWTILLISMSLWPMSSLSGKGGSYIVELEIEGFPPVILSEVPLISNETEVVEVRDEKDVIISKKPGKTRYTNIVLVIDLDVFPEQLLNWRQEIIEGILTKRWGIMAIKERQTGNVKIQHIFYEGWPSKLTYVFTGGKFYVHYEIAATRIQSKKFPLVQD